MGLAGRAPTGEAMNIATRTNRVVLSLRARGAVADGGSKQEEMANVEEEEATGEAWDVTMTETETAIATTTANKTETESEVVALATNVWSDPVRLRKVIRVDHCGFGNGGPM